MNLPFWAHKPVLATTQRIISGTVTLDQVQPGRTVIVRGYDCVDSIQQSHLQAYGVLPGRQMRVLQHRPETVIQVEFTELAFETETARQILVQIL